MREIRRRTRATDVTLVVVGAGTGRIRNTARGLVSGLPANLE
jgi:hypothetical protein